MRIFLLIVLSCLAWSAHAQVPWPPPPPPVTPPAGHPRLYVRPDTVKVFGERLRQKSFADYANVVKESSELTWDGTLPDKNGTTYDAILHARIEACAVRYLCEGDIEMGRRAVALMLKVLPSVTYPKVQDITRSMGATLHTAAIVYDWCYPLLTPADRQVFITHLKRIARQMEVGYPPRGGNDVVGHIGEAEIFRDQLAAGIAIYDEDPEMYTWAAGRLFAGLLPAREFFYSSHWHNQGSSYGKVRLSWELWSAAIFKAMTGKSPFSNHQTQLARTWLYIERPDGHFVPEGDVAGLPPQKQQPLKTDVYLFMTELITVYLSEDPVIAKALDRHLETAPAFRATLPYFLFAKPGIQTTSSSTLPLTKFFPEPASQMIARTGWSTGADSNDVIVQMKIAPWSFTNHQHLDAGSFQIWYRGALASKSGFYQGVGSGYGSPHFKNFYQRTVSHNTLTIEAPSENFVFQGKPVANDGGQHWPNGGKEPKTLQSMLASGDHRTGSLLGYGFGPDAQRPRYSHLAGSITSYGPKVDHFLRSFVFLNLESEQTPGVLIVYDRIRAAKPEFKKTWRMHTTEMPTVGNSQFSVSDPRGGRVVANVLLPEASDQRFTTIGGENIFLSDGKVYPVVPKHGTLATSDNAGWRVELSPATARNDDRFLVVLQLLNGQLSVKPLPVNRLETNQLLGVELPGWRVAFPRETALLSERFELPGSSAPAQVVVTGLAPGQWRTKSVRGAQVLTVAPGEHQLYLASVVGPVEFEPVVDGRVTNAPISSPQTAVVRMVP